MTGRTHSSFVRASSVPAGTLLNNVFRVDRALSAGGMGEVYRGHNIHTHDPVAIKIVLPEFAQDEMILELFRKEARVLNHLHHEAIVRYYVFAIDAELQRPFLAMEFVEGPSLAERIKAGPLDTHSVCVLQKRLADGLQRAHEGGVIHRDIAPDNIILPDGKVERAKIIDFGIARSAVVGGGTLLGSNFAGKYNFASPEQFGLFGSEVTNRSDIYSLGLVLAACLRGKALDMSGTPLEVIEKRRVVPDLSSIDPSMRELLEAMLQPDPQDRIASMAEVAAWRNPDETLVGPQTFRPAGLDPTEPSVRPPTVPPRQPTWPPAPGQRTSPPNVLRPTREASVPPAGMAGAQQSPSEPSFPPARSPEAPQLPREPAIPPPAGDEARPALGEPPVQPSEVAEARQEQRLPPAPQTQKRKSRRGLVLVGLAAVGILGGAAAAVYAPFDYGSVWEDIFGPNEQPPEPPALPRPDRTAEISAFLESYRPGGCFFASPAEVSGDKVTIVGLGQQEPVRRLLGEFKQRFGQEPDVRLQEVSTPQCAVVGALDQLVKSGAGSPALELDRAVVRSGENLSGTVSGFGDRHLEILVVDNQGLVQKLQYDKAGDAASFNVLLEGQLAEPQPQLILSVASAGPLQSLNEPWPGGFIQADDLIPKLLEEVKSRQDDVMAAAKYFTFGADVP